MKVLVTGARGFVGGFISRSLSRHTVITPTRQELDLMNLESVNNWFEQNEVDAVIHCALTGREDLFSTDPVYLSDGLLMFRNLWLNKHHYINFINLGTAYEFDLTVDNTLVREDDVIKHLPKTSYGYSKNLIARIIRETNDFYNLRLFGVFHETEKDIRFFKRVQLQDEVVINNDIKLDYIYLPDIMPMINYILDGYAQYRDINMVYPTKYHLSQLAYILCDNLGLSKNKIKIADRSGNNLTGNSFRNNNPGFNFIGLEQGLRNYK